MRWAVVLAGGAGTRFWPVSTTRRPKQLLPLAGNDSLLAQTIARVVPLIPAERILIVTSRALKDAVMRAVPAVPSGNVLAEPRAASTAPALAWATAHAARQDAAATVLSLHADWAVGDAAGFRAAATLALELAEREDVLVTVGAKPTRPETGYGYIVPGKPIGKRARSIAKFVEKPPLARARALLKARAVWNTGMFAWTASRFQAEVAAHTPEIAGAMELFDAGDAEHAYAALKPVSIDVGVFERTRRGAVISAAFGWDDIGSWAALRRVRPKDKNGNVTVGGAEVVDSKNCVAWSEDGTVVIYGMSDAVVVKTRGITL
ncbi:MAG: mannose-1-phosphate guanylyltransferase, partial [Gemmatimonadales bacterium]